MVAPRRFLAFVVLTAVAVASGCADRGRPPARQAPGPGAVNPLRPTVVWAGVGLTESFADGGGAVVGDLEFRESGEFTVGTEAFVFHAVLRPAPPADWYAANLKIKGGRHQPPRAELFQEGMVEVRFLPGSPGEEISIALSSVVPPDGQGDSLVVKLRRAAEPRVRLEVLEKGAWREALPGDVLEERPLTLRLVFSKEMDRVSVEESLASPGPLPGKLTWVDGRTLLWELLEPPAVIRPQLFQARDVEGLWVLGQVPVVYAGEPPCLCSFDPASGKEEKVCRVMADIWAASISPDGTMLLARAYAVTTGHPPMRSAAWLVETATGARRRLDDNWAYVGWVRGDRLLRVREGAYEIVETSGAVAQRRPLPRGLKLAAVSPDGEFLAGLVAGEPASGGEHHLHPHDLAIVHLDSGEEAWIRSFVDVYMPPTDWRAYAGPGWSPDGQRVAGLQDLARGCAVVVADLRTGGKQTAVTLEQLEHGTVDWFSWSPDGRFWLARNVLVSATPPHGAVSTPLQGWGRAWWSGDGQWVVKSRGPWEETLIYRPDSGALRRLGAAFPCGWDSRGLVYLVRWKGAEHGYRPEFAPDPY